MTPNYIVARRAQSDIIGIINYIAEDNVLAAMEVESDIYDAFEMIGDNPGIGHLREDLTRLPYRFWTVRGHYMIVYQEDDRVEIVRVLSGFMDIAAILDD